MERIDEMSGYSMQGHGCDTGIVRQVPPNCMYVTLTHCGQYMVTTSKLKEFMLDLFDARHPHHHWLKNPYQYKEELRDIGLNLHLHYDGLGCDPTYMDCKYQPFLSFTMKTGNFVRPSGLIPLGASLMMEDCPFPIHRMDDSTVPFITCKGQMIEKDVAQYIYKDSLAPTEKDITKSFSFYQSFFFEQMTKNVGTVLQSELFEKYPGIHYNVVCRSPCRTAPPESISLRRQHSNKQVETALLRPGYTPLTRDHLKNAVDLYMKTPDQFAPIGTWKVHHITDMSTLFEDTDFNEDISEWDVSNVKLMHRMFHNARQFNQTLEAWTPYKLTHFDAKNSQLSRLFKLPPTLIELNIRNCPIHQLEFDQLNPMIYIICEGAPLNHETVLRLIKFYSTTSELAENKRSVILDQFRSGALKRSRPMKSINCVKRFRSKKVQKLLTDSWKGYKDHLKKTKGLRKHDYSRFARDFKKGYMNSCKTQKNTKNTR